MRGEIRPSLTREIVRAWLITVLTGVGRSARIRNRYFDSQSDADVCRKLLAAHAAIAASMRAMMYVQTSIQVACAV